MWRCSFGVLNCPICHRPLDAKQKAEMLEAAKKKMESINKGVQSGRIKIKRSSLGKITIDGLTVEERQLADADILSGLQTFGNSLVKSKLPQFTAEQVRNTQTN